MKDKALKDEVRAAVHDYLDKLISERSRPDQGHTMAVSAHDLMVAAKTAGHRTSRTEADEVLDKLLKPPMPAVKPEIPSAKSDNSNRTSSGRSKSVPITNQPVEENKPKERGLKKKPSRKDYHFLVWKTTPTPAPSEVSASIHPSPQVQEPRPPSARPVSSRARTIRTPTPGFVTPLPVDYPSSPGPFRSPSEHPELKTLRLKSVTPIPTPPPPVPRVVTPAPVVLEDEAGKAVFVPTPPGNSVVTTQYVPALKAWVTNADDHEKEVAYNLFKTLNAGMNPLRIPSVKLRPRASRASPKSTPPGPSKLYKMPVAGVRTSMPASKAYMDKNIEDQYLKLVSRSLQNTEPSTYIYTGQNNTVRPWPTHLERPPTPIEYTNENAFFMNANHPYRSHFTIHPEWVSETSGSRNLRLLMCTQGPNGIRYMAQKN